ncbi:hypothetical protein CALCODRAFT_485265 [Calocera cornea HHB12733]|uniref:Uncharacterized protein n=1 Tax=Calocera cornea HHB12733 TaxID=1353952 RepID=A0A165EFW7_9BASI|nr:hypothetical protein CALCODRAFT_485265 [Calocera cornea HHB12733]
MPFATARTGLRFGPSEESARSEGSELEPTGAQASTTKTVEELLGGPVTQRLSFAPRLDSIRKDWEESAILSVETIRLLEYPVPSRTPEQADEDRQFVAWLERAVSGHGVAGHDIAWVPHEHSACLWARSNEDWTVFAQPYNASWPHRPYCEGPPAHPLSSKVWWVVLLKAAFSASSPDEDAVGIIHPRWVALLKAAHAHWLALAEWRLLHVPGTEVRRIYVPLRSKWAAVFDWEHLSRPATYKQCAQVWLLAQCKTRDLLGIVNYLDSHYLRHIPRMLENAPWVFNFVGVTEESIPSETERSVLIRDGVPILEAVFDDSKSRWGDICHTDAWVLEERRTLRKEGKMPTSFPINQSRHPDCLPLDKRKAGARPNKHVREGMKRAAQALSSSAAGAAPAAPAAAASSSAPAMVRKRVLEVEELYERRDGRGELTGEGRAQARWSDSPALWPGREIRPIPEGRLGGPSSTAYGAARPSGTTPTAGQVTPWEAIAEPYRSEMRNAYLAITTGPTTTTTISPSPATTSPPPSRIPTPPAAVPIAPTAIPTTGNTTTSPTGSSTRSRSPSAGTSTGADMRAGEGVNADTPHVAKADAERPRKSMTLRDWTAARRARARGDNGQ